jgi:hypothetical protein
MIKYLSMPSLFQWKMKDSYIRDIRVTRRSDKILCGIDSIVEAIGKSNKNGMRNYLMVELYFATNYWLRNFQLVRTNQPVRTDPKLDRIQFLRAGMHPGREDAIRALCRYSIEQMAKGFGCGVQAVPTQLERYYGRTMGSLGHQKDTENPGHYMKRAEVEQYKLFFDGGKAYCFDWQNRRFGQDFVLELADTQYIWNRDSEQKTMGGHFSRFAMSMSRDIYLAPHVSYDAAVNYRKAGFLAPAVHSSYLGGLPVLCAGSLCINSKGEVTDVKSDSGHYQPVFHQLMNLIQHLAVVGVNLANVTVVDFTGWPLGTGKQFLANEQHWRKRVDHVGEVYRQSKNVEQLVEERISDLKKTVYFSKLKNAVKEEDIRKAAFKSICEDLAIALNDPSWREFAEKRRVMPERQAPQPPRRPPPRPTTPHPGKFKTTA